MRSNFQFGIVPGKFDILLSTCVCVRVGVGGGGGEKRGKSRFIVHIEKYIIQKLIFAYSLHLPTLVYVDWFSGSENCK